MVLPVAVLLVLASAAPAYAVHYSCIAQAYNGATKTVGYGTEAKLYIYPKQSPQDGDWVNSIYAGNMYGAFYEAGWYWGPNVYGTPQVFTHLYDGITHYERLKTTSLTPGTRHYFRVANNRVDFTYRAYVDGQIIDTWTNTTIRSSYPCVGAERYNTLDYNKGQFQYVAYLHKSANLWAYWQDGANNNHTDPVYRPYYNYLDRPDHYVHVDDHQN